MLSWILIDCCGMIIMGLHTEQENTFPLKRQMILLINSIMLDIMMFVFIHPHQIWLGIPKVRIIQKEYIWSTMAIRLKIKQENNK